MRSEVWQWQNFMFKPHLPSIFQVDKQTPQSVVPGSGGMGITPRVVSGPVEKMRNADCAPPGIQV